MMLKGGIIKGGHQLDMTPMDIISRRCFAKSLELIKSTVGTRKKISPSINLMPFSVSLLAVGGFFLDSTIVKKKKKAGKLRKTWMWKPC